MPHVFLHSLNVTSDVPGGSLRARPRAPAVEWANNSNKGVKVQQTEGLAMKSGKDQGVF